MLTHSVHFSAGYQKEGMGKHPPHLALVCKGDAGALVFDICTGWYLDGEVTRPYCQLVFHSYVTDPHFDEEALNETCDWLDGEPCIVTYSWFTGEKLDDLFHGLKAEGLPKTQLCMEEIYKEITECDC